VPDHSRRYVWPRRAIQREELFQLRIGAVQVAVLDLAELAGATTMDEIFPVSAPRDEEEDDDAA